MPTPRRPRRLWDTYRFAGFRPSSRVVGIFGGPSAPSPAGICAFHLEVEVRRVACRHCGTVKQERLDFLADNSFYTKRFAFYVGRRCRASPIRDVAKELRLDWHTVKALEQQYMREQLRRGGPPGPRVIGLDEVSIKKGHTYRIVVSDLVRHRPIWFGGTDRSEASLDQV